MDEAGAIEGGAVPHEGAVIERQDELTPLHPDHVKVLRISALFYLVPLLIAAIVFELIGFAPAGIFVVPVLVFAVLVLWRVPLRRYHAKGYRMGSDRLRVVRGLWFRSDTVVPFGRVQHIDVHQGPVERHYDLATLVLHTAGTHNASVALPGLLNETALEMRETIRERIKRDTM